MSHWRRRSTRALARLYMAGVPLTTEETERVQKFLRDENGLNMQAGYHRFIRQRAGWVYLPGWLVLFVILGSLAIYYSAETSLCP